MMHYLSLEPRKIFIAFRHLLLYMPPAAEKKKTLSYSEQDVLVEEHII